ncbi:MAG: phosphate ABC transporter permease PstA [Planctomycetaceae bacterium]
MSQAPPAGVHPATSRGRLFAALCQTATWSGVGVLALLLVCVLWQSWGWLNLPFLTNYDSAIDPHRAGILAGLWGSFWLMLLTMLISVPVGIGAAIYLEEYAGDTWLTRLIRVNLANLAGVPSIVYGILGLTVFVRMFGIFGAGGLVQQLTGWEVVAIRVVGIRIPLPLGSAVLAGALTLSLMILPVLIVASQEALRAVPPSIRHASLALGATRWQTVRHQVLPAAVPGMLTGIILSASRAIGETAPLIMVGAATFLRSTPGGITHVTQLLTDLPRVLDAPFSEYTALTIQVYNWVKQPSDDFRHAAAAGILVLLIALLTLNALAIYVRNRFQKRLSA